MDVKKKLKLFGSTEFSQDFIHDLDLLLRLSPEDRAVLSSFFANRSEFFSKLAEEEINTLKKTIKVSKEDAKDLCDITRFLLHHIAIKGTALQEIEEDFVTLNKSTGEIDAIKGYLSIITEKQKNLKNDALKTVASTSTIATVDQLGFSIDIRAVHDDEDKLIDIVPILVVRMILEGFKEKQEVVFQLTKTTLDQFCEMFSKEKDKLDEASQCICIKEK